MPCCLFYCPLAFQLDPKPFKRVIAFRVSPLKKSKGYPLDSGMTPTRSEKKKTLLPLNTKPNSPSQRAEHVTFNHAISVVFNEQQQQHLFILKEK